MELSEICHKNEIWLHVDAAWGGSCLFSTEHAKLMAGVELADSVCWDAHKLMGVPLICSAFLIKDLSLLRKVCSHGDAAHYSMMRPNRMTLVVYHYNVAVEMTL